MQQVCGNPGWGTLLHCMLLQLRAGVTGLQRSFQAVLT